MRKATWIVMREAIQIWIVMGEDNYLDSYSRGYLDRYTIQIVILEAIQLIILEAISMIMQEAIWIWKVYARCYLDLDSYTRSYLDSKRDAIYR